MQAATADCSALRPGQALSRGPLDRPVLVLGAGPAGIAAGLALGSDAAVLDSAATVGGLCRTIDFAGSVFDWGGHSFHTPHPEIRDLVFGSLEMYEQKRQAYCWVAGQRIPYPFQTHFEQLTDRALASACREGLRMADGGTGAENFENWALRKFGPGIADHFLLPFNRKLWGQDLKRLALDWTDQRVANAGDTRQTFATAGGRRSPLQGDTTVAYPAHGGFGEVMLALARRLPDLRLGRKIIRIDPLRRRLFTDRGEILSWRHLVSTLPLDRLIHLLPDVPAGLVDAAGSLEALSLILVLVVIAEPVRHEVQRVYCAGDEVPAHKIVINHNSSTSLRSRPCHGILAEISAAGIEESDTTLQRNVVNGLCRMGFLNSPRDVRAIRTLHVARAYPVPTHGRVAAVQDLRTWLAERDLHVAGRFGEWAYINSDEALYRGLKLGQRLRAGVSA